MTYLALVNIKMHCTRYIYIVINIDRQFCDKCIVQLMVIYYTHMQWTTEAERKKKKSLVGNFRYLVLAMFNQVYILNTGVQIPSI